MNKLLVVMLIFFSCSGFGANNSIELTIDVTTDASLLLLPIPDETVSAQATLSIHYNNIPVDATFYTVTHWPHTGTPFYIRTLLIDATALSGFVGKLSLVWSNTPAKNAVNVSFLSPEQLRATYSAKHRKASLVYPSAQWLRQSVLLHASDKSVDDDWYVLPQQKYAHFVTNEAAMRKKGYPPKKAGQWLYDRPQAIYQLFVMSEDRQWLDKANTLTEFYKQHIDSKGQFTLIKRFDPKYLMPRGLAYQYLLTADETALTTLKRIFNRSLDWNEHYSLSRGFWTERNQAAALNVAVTYWELTSDIKALARINNIIDATVKMTFNPVSNWPVRGCPQHSFKSHEGWGDDSAACSPWMMALLADALWRYYRLTGNEKSASLLNAFGDFILNHGIYFGNKRVNNIVIPKYIVSLDNPKQEELDQWSNPQHACDVAGLLGKSVYIKQRKRQDDFLVKELFRSLVEQCKKPYRKLKAEKKATQYWSLKPARRFAWLYSSTSDLPWLVDHLLN